MAKKKLYHRKQAKEVATKVINILSPFSKEIYIAGSLARGRDRVHDVDIVCLPKDEFGIFYGIERALGERGAIIRQKGNKKWSLELDGIPVDIWWANDENIGTILLIRTGPREFNIALIKRAKRMSLEFKASKGVYKDGKLIASRTEQEIFNALELPYIRPALRDLPLEEAVTAERQLSYEEALELAMDPSYFDEDEWEG